MLGRDPAAAVQRAILREYLHSGRTSARLFDLGAALIFWPWRSFAQAWRLTGQVGGSMIAVRSRSAQFLQQIYLAWFHGISPSMYYEMGLAATLEKHSPMAWLQAGHAGLLSRVFRTDKQLVEINDKKLFNELLATNGLPVAPAVGVVGPRILQDQSARESILERLAGEREIFVKPVRGSGGKGSRALVRTDSRKWLGQASIAVGPRPIVTFSDNQLVQLLAKNSGLYGWLIQRRLKNHPIIEELCGPGLACLRVVSGLGGDEVTVLRSVMCFPLPGRIISQHGMTAAIERSTGRLGKLFKSSPDQQMYSHNPANGVKVEDVLLPFWDEAMFAVKRAHRVLDSYAFLGWDVAICPEGPVILEANGNYGTGAMQKPGSRPLIDEQFLAVFEYWEERKRAAGLTGERDNG